MIRYNVLGIENRSNEFCDLNASCKVVRGEQLMYIRK